MTGKNILMCDFSFDYEQISKLIDASTSFMILDHHKTAQSALDQIQNELKIFDMDRSGVGITWEFFFETQNLPTFLTYIQDRDLWTKKYPQTEKFVTYLFEQEYDFDLWETFLSDTELYKAIDTGSKWLIYKDTLVDKCVSSGFIKIHEIDGSHMIVAYAYNELFKSDVGNKLFNKYPFADFFLCI